MSGDVATWRFDVADGYFGEPVAIKKAQSWWQLDVELHVEFAAEEAAEQYHSENDGWEDDWPVTFHIYPPFAETPTSVVVDREYEPVFSGSVLEATP